MRPRVLTTLTLLACAASLTACERIKRDMYDQPRDKAYGADAFFPDHAASRPAIAGTVARSRGALADASGGQLDDTGLQDDRRWEDVQENPLPMDLEVLARGRERYGIYCLPCHSPAGDGDGRIVRRGFPSPPTFHEDRLRNAPDRHLFDVITQGYGVMHRYGDRVPVSDRWAIVHFIRALQLSQHARVDALPEPVRAATVDALRRESGPVRDAVPAKDTP